MRNPTQSLRKRFWRTWVCLIISGALQEFAGIQPVKKRIRRTCLTIHWHPLLPSCCPRPPHLALVELQAALCHYEQEKPMFETQMKIGWQHHSITIVAIQKDVLLPGSYGLRTTWSFIPQEMAGGWGCFSGPWQLCWPKKRLSWEGGGFLQWIPIFWNEIATEGTFRWTEREREGERERESTTPKVLSGI